MFDTLVKELTNLLRTLGVHDEIAALRDEVRGLTTRVRALEAGITKARAPEPQSPGGFRFPPGDRLRKSVARDFESMLADTGHQARVVDMRPTPPERKCEYTGCDLPRTRRVCYWNDGYENKKYGYYCDEHARKMEEP